MLNTSKNFRQLDRKHFLVHRIVFVVIWSIRFIKEWQYDVYIPSLKQYTVARVTSISFALCIQQTVGLEMTVTGHLNDVLKARFTVVLSLIDAICTLVDHKAIVYI